MQGAAGPCRHETVVGWYGFTSSEAGSSTEPKATKMKDLSDSAKKRTRATDAANIKRKGQIDLVSPVKTEGCSYIA